MDLRDPDDELRGWLVAGAQASAGFGAMLAVAIPSDFRSFGWDALGGGAFVFLLANATAVLRWIRGLLPLWFEKNGLAFACIGITWPALSILVFFVLAYAGVLHFE